MSRANRAADTLKQLNQALTKVRQPEDYLPFFDPDPHDNRGPSLQHTFIRSRNETFDQSLNPETLANVFFELIVGTPIKEQTKQGKLLETVMDLNSGNTRFVYEKIPILQTKIIDQIIDAWIISTVNPIPEEKRELENAIRDPDIKNVALKKLISDAKNIETLISDLQFVLVTLKHILENQHGSTYFNKELSPIGHKRKTEGQLFEIVIEIEGSLNTIKNTIKNELQKSDKNIQPNEKTMRQIAEIQNVAHNIKKDFFSKPMRVVSYPILHWQAAKFSKPDSVTPAQAPAPQKKIATPNVAGYLAKEAKAGEKKTIPFADPEEKKGPSTPSH